MFRRPKLADELLQPLRCGSLRLQHLARPRNGLGDARLVERLQDVVHGVYVKRLYGVLVKRRGKYDVGHFHLAFDDLFQHTKPVQSRHFYVQKYQIGRVFFDQGNGFHAVLSLPDYIDFREAFQKERELVARGLFVIHDDGVDRHFLCFSGCFYGRAGLPRRHPSGIRS